MINNWVEIIVGAKLSSVITYKNGCIRVPVGFTSGHSRCRVYYDKDYNRVHLIFTSNPAHGFKIRLEPSRKIVLIRVPQLQCMDIQNSDIIVEREVGGQS